jgi:Ca2+/H+ antiporter
LPAKRTGRRGCPELGQVVSAGVAGTLIVLYAEALVFTQFTKTHLFGTSASNEQPEWLRRFASSVLLGAALLVGAGVPGCWFRLSTRRFSRLIRPMDFVFTGFEIGAVRIATLLIALISRDGHSNSLGGPATGGRLRHRRAGSLLRLVEQLATERQAVDQVDLDPDAQAPSGRNRDRAAALQDERGLDDIFGPVPIAGGNVAR